MEWTAVGIALLGIILALCLWIIVRKIRRIRRKGFGCCGSCQKCINKKDDCACHKPQESNDSPSQDIK